MRDNINFTGQRMRQAMDERGLTSGEIAKVMHVSDGAVRGWTTGRRKIGLDDLSSFATIVGYPIEYFIKADYVLHEGFAVHDQLQKLARDIDDLSKRIPSPTGDQQPSTANKEPSKEDVLVRLRTFGDKLTPEDVKQIEAEIEIIKEKYLKGEL
jgi:transcriptional regulator with XRE-family HTH domain